MGGSSFWRVMSEVYASVKGLFRYKETLFWVILFPILWYGLMAAVWGNPNPPTVKVGVYNADPLHGNGTLGEVLVKAFNSTDYFKVRTYSDSKSLIDVVKKGSVDVGVAIPGNFTEFIFNGSPALVSVIYEESQWGSFAYSSVLWFLNSFGDRIRGEVVNMSIQYIEQASNGTGWGNYTGYAIKWLKFIADPLRVNETRLTPPLLASSGGLRAYYALSMIGVEALFVGLFAGALAINERKRSGTLTVILSSPLRDWELLVADTVSALTLIGFSAAAVIVVSLATGAEYSVSPPILLLAVAFYIVGALFTVGLGLLIAPLAKTPEGASALVNAIAFPAMFVGGIAIPAFMLPRYLRVFAENWPLGRAIGAARHLLLQLMSPWEALYYALPAVVSTIVIYAIGALVYRRLLWRTIEYH